MLIGSSLLCLLVLLVFLADRLGSSVWHGGADHVYFRCAECDLRYPRREISDPRFQFCPAGHTVVMEPRRATAGLVGIFACVGFLTVAILLMVTGLVPIR